MAITEKGRALGVRVRELRKALGLTQEQVSQATQRTTISQIENGWSQLSTEAIRTMLASGFGLTRDTLALYLDGEITVKQAKRRSSIATSRKAG